MSILMQKCAENCSFYVLKVQKIWHKIVTFSAPNILDPLLTLNMHLIINNALLWDQKGLYWRDSEIIKGAGLVLRPTTVPSWSCFLSFFHVQTSRQWYWNTLKIRIPNGPKNSKSTRFIWVFIVLSIYNFKDKLGHSKGKKKKKKYLNELTLLNFC